MTIHKNMNLREAVILARKLGATVENRVGTGEIVFAHPAMRERKRTSMNRKGTNQPLVSWLRQLEAKVADGEA